MILFVNIIISSNIIMGDCLELDSVVVSHGIANMSDITLATLFQTYEIDRSANVMSTAPTNNYVKWSVPKADFCSYISTSGTGTDVSGGVDDQEFSFTYAAKTFTYLGVSLAADIPLTYTIPFTDFNTVCPHVTSSATTSGATGSSVGVASNPGAATTGTTLANGNLVLTAVLNATTSAPDIAGFKYNVSSGEVELTKTDNIMASDFVRFDGGVTSSAQAGLQTMTAGGSSAAVAGDWTASNPNTAASVDTLTGGIGAGSFAIEGYVTLKNSAKNGTPEVTGMTISSTNITAAVHQILADHTLAPANNTNVRAALAAASNLTSVKGQAADITGLTVTLDVQPQTYSTPGATGGSMVNGTATQKTFAIPNLTPWIILA
jgi:hypothetical protein